ncbi:MAG: efflux RND transporter periplasmic adaptor subunit [Rhizobium sp.]|nr:efflux RND transporter periplasmic adaptor subunit [Rhizobium sp.]
MKRSNLPRSVLVAAALVPLVLLLAYVALRAGPLAPVEVTVAEVRSAELTPALFGVGTVEARQRHRIGPTLAGRLASVEVDVGDTVSRGQVVARLDPVDLDDRLRAAASALDRLAAERRQAESRARTARSQAQRFEALRERQLVAEDAAQARREDAMSAEAALSATTAEAARLQAELDALHSQRDNLALVSPIDGLVISRLADPGTTLVAGQAALDVMSADGAWVHARFDQATAMGLAQGLPADITLRSAPGERLPARVARVEPVADAVTEELLAKFAFEPVLASPPPIGELAEVTVRLATLPAAPVIDNASVFHVAGETGAWRIVDGDLAWTPLKLGRADLDGHVQVLEGLSPGDTVVRHAAAPLRAGSAVDVVETLKGRQP